MMENKKKETIAFIIVIIGVVLCISGIYFGNSWLTFGSLFGAAAAIFWIKPKFENKKQSFAEEDDVKLDDVLAQAKLNKTVRKKRPQHLHAYMCTNYNDDEGSVAIIAYTGRKAKVYAYRYMKMFDAWNLIDIRVKRVSDGNIDGLKDGDVIDDYKDGLKRQLYGYIEDVCDECHLDSVLMTVIGDKCVCSSCEETLTAQQAKRDEGA